MAMTNEEKDEINKVIAEAMGKCWHKWQLNDDEMVCRRCQRKILFYGDPYVEISLPPRPDFLTSAEDLLRMVEWGIEEDFCIHSDSYGRATAIYNLDVEELIEKKDGLFTLPVKVAEVLREGKG